MIYPHNVWLCVFGQLLVCIHTQGHIQQVLHACIPLPAFCLIAYIYTMSGKAAAKSPISYQHGLSRATYIYWPIHSLLVKYLLFRTREKTNKGTSSPTTKSRVDKTSLDIQLSRVVLIFQMSQLSKQAGHLYFSHVQILDNK